MMDAEEEIGISAHRGWQMHLRLVHRNQSIVRNCRPDSWIATCIQQIADDDSQPPDIVDPRRKKRIEIAALPEKAQILRQQRCGIQSAKIKNMRANCDAGAPIDPIPTDYTQRQVLDGEISVRRVDRKSKRLNSSPYFTYL